MKWLAGWSVGMVGVYFRIPFFNLFDMIFTAISQMISL
jgi:hypothetical protein